MIKIFSDLEALNLFAADTFIEIAKNAIGQYGSFTVALAGGSTSKSPYQLLSSGNFRDKIDF